MNRFLKEYNFYVYLLFFGFILIFITNYLLQLNLQTFVYLDSESYLVAAKNLYIFHRGHQYRPILMALITGFPYLFSMNDAFIFKWIFYVNIFCWLCTSLILFDIIKSFTKLKIAFIFTIIYMFSFGVIANMFHLLAETIFTFFIILTFYFLKKYFDKGNFFYLSIAISLLILSMLIKPASKFLAILVLSYFIKTIFKNYKQKSIYLIYLSISAILIQITGMKYQFGGFTISYIDVVTYHNYLCSKSKCLEKGIIFDQIRNPRANYLFKLNCENQSKLAKNDLIDQIIHNKKYLIKAYFLDLMDNTFHGSQPIYDSINVVKTKYFCKIKSYFYLISKIQNILFTISGVFLSLYFILFKNKTEKLFLFVSTAIIYIIFISGISCDQMDSFHIVVYPFIVLLISKIFSDLFLSKKSSDLVNK